MEQRRFLVPHRPLEDFLGRDITQAVRPFHRLGHHPGEGTGSQRSPALNRRTRSASEDVPYNTRHVTVFPGVCQGLLYVVQERGDDDGGVPWLPRDRMDEIAFHP